MIALAYNDEDERMTLLYIVIENSNLERMGTGDPITLPPRHQPDESQRSMTAMDSVKYPQNLGIIVCYEPDSARLNELMAKGHTGALMNYLVRNLDMKRNDGVLAGVMGEGKGLTLEEIVARVMGGTAQA